MTTGLFCLSKDSDRKESLFRVHNVKEETHAAKNKNAKAFYTQSPEEVFTGRMRLSKVCHQVGGGKKRLAEFGHNELEEGERRSILSQIHRAI